jgi:hypothetical protein
LSRHKSGGLLTRPPVVFVDLAILLLGAVTAASAGVFIYGMAGPYAHGFLNFGVDRTIDPRSQHPVLVRNVVRADGFTVRYFFDMETRRLTGTRVLAPGTATADDMVPPPPDEFARRAAKPGGGTGFSLAGNGVIDAWQYLDALGRPERIEISRRQNGQIDRWEFYKDGQLSRVEEDNDHDGRVDRWLTYDAGILVKEALDRDGDGRPDRSS